MAKIEYENSRGLILELRGNESFNDIQETLLTHCDEMMGANSPDIIVEYPVYLKEAYESYFDGKGVRFTHIGYVKLVYDKEEAIYIVQHFTLDRKELHLDTVNDFQKWMSEKAVNAWKVS
ncbi:hypothetical protein [Photorhabdus sp. RM323S]|uniref:hypothetical protein n=1 Tax=Photorhabdus sp. RM323S TaxID=3342828 RepID=UPI0036D7691E